MRADLPHGQATPMPRIASFKLSILLICLSLVGEPMKKEVTPERWILSPAFGHQVAFSGWPPKLEVGDTPKLIGENQERDDQQP
jgi:hypothetical protein